MTTAELAGNSGIQSPPVSELDDSAPDQADSEVRQPPQSATRHRAWRISKRAFGLSALIAVALTGAILGGTVIPTVLIAYVICGLLDVLRNTRRDLFTIDNYFFGNGFGTWLLSPFNLLMDVLALPYLNRGVYHLSELPGPIREEINDLIRAAHESDVIVQLEKRIGDGRSMIFFKWYGRNINNSIHVPAFHRQYRYIRTIGVSVFNRRKSTSWHFGPLRATLRVLYNLRPSADDAAFIQVGRHTHRWNKGPLFIFDDTHMHQSRNETDDVRYCMFIDLIRPSLCRPLIGAIVTGLRFLLLPMRFLFYRRWAEIR